MVTIISQALNQKISSQGEFFLGGILIPERIRDDIISTPLYSHKLHWFTPPAKWHWSAGNCFLLSKPRSSLGSGAIETFFLRNCPVLFFKILSLAPPPASPALPCIPSVFPWAAAKANVRERLRLVGSSSCTHWSGQIEYLPAEPFLLYPY